MTQTVPDISPLMPMHQDPLLVLVREGTFNWNTSLMVMIFCGLHNEDFNTLRPRQNVRHFADDTFKRIFFKENVRILIKISLKFVPESPIDNIPALFQIMAWRRPGDKPLSEPMMVSLLTHICVTRRQWVKEPIQMFYDDNNFPVVTMNDLIGV